MSLISELQRRNVIRVAMAYVALAYLAHLYVEVGRKDEATEALSETINPPRYFGGATCGDPP